MKTTPSRSSLLCLLALSAVLTVATVAAQDYCDNDSDCNDRGECVNSTTCECYAPFTGNNCETDGGVVSINVNPYKRTTILLEPCSSVTLSTSITPAADEFLDFRWTVETDRRGDTGGIRASINPGTAPEYDDNYHVCVIDGGVVDESVLDIAATIPDMFAFDGSGTNFIVDGGSDMYDNGNYLDTNLGGSMTYFDGSIEDGSIFGTDAVAINQIVDGLFVLSVTDMDITDFTVSGSIGVADSEYIDSLDLDGLTLITRTTYGSSTPSITKIVVLPPGGPYVASGGGVNSDYLDITGLDEADWMLYAVFSTYDEEEEEGTLPHTTTVKNVARTLLNTFGPYACNRLGFDCGALSTGDYFLKFESHPEVTTPVMISVVALLEPVVDDGAFNTTDTLGTGEFAASSELHRITAHLPDFEENAVITASFSLGLEPLTPIRVYINDDSEAGIGPCTNHIDRVCAGSECEFDIPPCAVSPEGELHFSLYSEGMYYNNGTVVNVTEIATPIYNNGTWVNATDLGNGTYVNGSYAYSYTPGVRVGNMTVALNYTLNVTVVSQTSESAVGVIPLSLYEDDQRNTRVFHFAVPNTAHSVSVALSGVLSGQMSAYLNNAGYPVADHTGGETEMCLDSDYGSCGTGTDYGCEVYATQCDEDIAAMRGMNWYVTVVATSADDADEPVTGNLIIDIVNPYTVQAVPLGGAASVAVSGTTPVAYFSVVVTPAMAANRRGLELTFFSDQGAGAADFTLYYEVGSLPDADCENAISWDSGIDTTTFTLDGCELEVGTYYFAVVNDDVFYTSELLVTATARQPAVITIPANHHHTGFLREGAEEFFVIDLPNNLGSGPLVDVAIEVSVETTSSNGYVAISTTPVGGPSCCDNAVEASTTFASSATVSLHSSCGYTGGNIHAVVASTASDTSYAIFVRIVEEDASSAPRLALGTVYAFPEDEDAVSTWARIPVVLPNAGDRRLEIDFFSEDHGATAIVRHNSLPLYSDAFDTPCDIDADYEYSCSTSSEACRIVVPACDVMEGEYLLFTDTTEAFSVRARLINPTPTTVPVPGAATERTQSVPGDESEVFFRVPVPNNMLATDTLAIDVFGEDTSGLDFEVDAFVNSPGGDCSDDSPIVECDSTYYCKIRLDACRLAGSTAVTVVVHPDSTDDSAWGFVTVAAHVAKPTALENGVNAVGMSSDTYPVLFEFDASAVEFGRFDSLVFTFGSTSSFDDCDIYFLVVPEGTTPELLPGPDDECCSTYDKRYISVDDFVYTIDNCDIDTTATYLVAVYGENTDPVGYTLRAEVVSPHAVSYIDGPTLTGFDNQTRVTASDLITYDHIEVYVVDISHLPADTVITVVTDVDYGSAYIGYDLGGSEIGLGGRCTAHTLQWVNSNERDEIVKCDADTAELVLYISVSGLDDADVPLEFTFTLFAATPTVVSASLGSTYITGSLRENEVALYSFDLSGFDALSTLDIYLPWRNGTLSIRVTTDEVVSTSSSLCSSAGSGTTCATGTGGCTFSWDLCEFTPAVYHVYVRADTPKAYSGVADYGLRLNVSTDYSATDLSTTLSGETQDNTEDGKLYVFTPTGGKHAHYAVEFDDLLDGWLNVYVNYGSAASSSCWETSRSVTSTPNTIPLRRLACSDCTGDELEDIYIYVVPSNIFASNVEYDIWVSVTEATALTAGASHAASLNNGGVGLFSLDLSDAWYPTVIATVTEDDGDVEIGYNFEWPECSTSVTAVAARTLYDVCTFNGVNTLWIEAEGQDDDTDFTLRYQVNSATNALTEDSAVTFTPAVTGDSYTRYRIDAPTSGWPAGGSLELDAYDVNGTANIYIVTESDCYDDSCTATAGGDCEFIYDSCSLGDYGDWFLIVVDGDADVTLQYNINEVTDFALDEVVSGSVYGSTPAAAEYAHYSLDVSSVTGFLHINFTVEGDADLYWTHDAAYASDACSDNSLSVSDDWTDTLIVPVDVADQTYTFTVHTTTEANYSVVVTTLGSVTPLPYGVWTNQTASVDDVDIPVIFSLDVSAYSNRYLADATLKVNMSTIDCPDLVAYAAVDYLPETSNFDYSSTSHAGHFYRYETFDISADDFTNANTVYISVYGTGLTADEDYNIRWWMSGIDDSPSQLIEWTPVVMGVNDTYEFNIQYLRNTAYLDVYVEPADGEDVTATVWYGDVFYGDDSSDEPFTVYEEYTCDLYYESAPVRVTVSGEATVTLRTHDKHAIYLEENTPVLWQEASEGDIFVGTIAADYDPTSEVYYLTVRGATEEVTLFYGVPNDDSWCDYDNDIDFDAADLVDSDNYRGSFSYASMPTGKHTSSLVGAAEVNATVEWVRVSPTITDVSEGGKFCDSVYDYEYVYYSIDKSTLAADEWYELAISNNDVTMYVLPGSLPSEYNYDDDYSDDDGITLCDYDEDMIYFAVYNDAGDSEFKEYTLTVEIVSTAATITVASGERVDVHIDDSVHVVVTGATSAYSYGVVDSGSFGSYSVYSHHIYYAINGETATPDCGSLSCFYSYSCSDTICNTGVGDVSLLVTSFTNTQLELQLDIVNPTVTTITANSVVDGHIAGADGVDYYFIDGLTDPYSVTTITLYGSNVRVYADTESAALSCMAFNCAPGSDGECSITFSDPCDRDDLSNGLVIAVAEDSSYPEGACYTLVANVTTTPSEAVTVLSPGVVSSAVAASDVHYYEIPLSDADTYYAFQVDSTAYGSVTAGYSEGLDTIGSSCGLTYTVDAYEMYSGCGSDTSVYLEVAYDSGDGDHAYSEVEYSVTVVEIDVLTTDETATFSDLSGPSIIRVDMASTASISASVDFSDDDLDYDFTVLISGGLPGCEDDDEAESWFDHVTTTCRHGQTCTLAEKARAEANENYGTRYVVIRPVNTLASDATYDVTVTLGTDNCAAVSKSDLDFCSNRFTGDVWAFDSATSADSRASEYASWLLDEFDGCGAVDVYSDACVAAVTALSCGVAFDTCDSNGFTNDVPKCLCDSVQRACGLPNEGDLSYSYALTYRSCSPVDYAGACEDVDASTGPGKNPTDSTKKDKKNPLTTPGAIVGWTILALFVVAAAVVGALFAFGIIGKKAASAAGRSGSRVAAQDASESGSEASASDDKKKKGKDSPTPIPKPGKEA